MAPGGSRGRSLTSGAWAPSSASPAGPTASGMDEELKEAPHYQMVTVSLSVPCLQPPGLAFVVRTQTPTRLHSVLKMKGPTKSGLQVSPGVTLLSPRNIPPYVPPLRCHSSLVPELSTSGSAPPFDTSVGA